MMDWLSGVSGLTGFPGSMIRHSKIKPPKGRGQFNILALQGVLAEGLLDEWNPKEMRLHMCIYQGSN